MGKKKKARKKKEKRTLKARKALISGMDTLSFKSKCCKKYKKCEDKRCKRCPCFDLLQKVA